MPVTVVDENLAPNIQGWCPGALRPMLSGDGWVVRVRPPLGRLTAVQAVQLANLAVIHGNGHINLSSRANIQIRGVSEDSYAPLIKGLDLLGLLDPDAGQEARRNVLITPFWNEGDESPSLAENLTAALGLMEAPMLPSKFGFAIDTGAVPVLQDASADIRFERDKNGGMICCVDGATTGAPVKVDNAVDAALALATWFVDSGGVSHGRGRMAAHLRRGAILPAAFLQVPRQMQHGMGQAPSPGPCAAGLMVALALGQMDAVTLRSLAEYGALRITPWRMLLIEGVSAVRTGLSELITGADDPLLRVIACTGAPGCRQGLQKTYDIARALADFVPRGKVLHVSGCAKACAHPKAASWTLVATPRGFDIIRNGTTTTPPLVTGIAPDAASLSRFF